MENNHFDETMPVPTGQEKPGEAPPGRAAGGLEGASVGGAENEQADPGETRLTPAAQERRVGASNAETMAVPVGENPPPAPEAAPTQPERPDLAETMVVPLSEPPASAAAFEAPPLPPTPPPAPAKRGGKRSWIWMTLLGLLALLVVAGVSAWSGYNSGIALRTGAESTQVAAQLDQQFQLGLQDIAENNYDRARQRFEYVIKQNPSYPGVTEKLAEVLLELNTTATPTVAPTPTLTPTPDTRDVEELFSQGQQYLANSQWTETIDTLLTLRKRDPNFHAVDVDGMLYLALRNRGKDKIGKEADLEGGIYDLHQAARFGPLDSEAQGYLTWSELYITGASFWDINWEQALNYFSQVAPALPNLRDGSGLTASERYRIALIKYGDTLIDKDPCAAMSQYEQALNMAQDPDAQQGYELAYQGCVGNADGGNKDNPPNSGDGDSVTPPPDAAPPIEPSPTPKRQK